jgi:heterogeneous nuclear ribonucleoprotein F/H
MSDSEDQKMIRGDDEYVVKVRGLPWSTTVDEILKFFGKSHIFMIYLRTFIKTYLVHLASGDCNIKDGKLGIQMTMSREGRPSGEAYIEMEGLDDIEIGLKKDKEHMGHRYIEGTAISCHFLAAVINNFVMQCLRLSDLKWTGSLNGVD